MRSAIITIGDEILIGQVTDTNAVWISQQLNSIGVQVGEMVTVSDEAGQINVTLDRYIGKYDLLIMTGGLGSAMCSKLSTSIMRSGRSVLSKTNRSWLPSCMGVPERKRTASAWSQKNLTALWLKVS